MFQECSRNSKIVHELSPKIVSVCFVSTVGLRKCLQCLECSKISVVPKLSRIADAAVETKQNEYMFGGGKD